MSLPLRHLGKSGVDVPALGVGTNRWGFGSNNADVVLPAFSEAISSGCGLFDTAEMYMSERVIGECMRRDTRPVLLVDKYAPYPTRFSSRSLSRALGRSLKRLGASSVDLYLVHFPYTPRSIDSLMDMLADEVHAGTARAIGVSNFSAKQMHAAAERLARHGVVLAANEVHFSLFHRAPEQNGVLEACRELDVALIAYRPLAGGRNQPDRTGLDRALASIAAAREKSVSQVALNWLLNTDEHVIAIPGTTNAAHLRDNIDALGWSLTEDERLLLETA